ncbi:MAG: AmmeMemoRadiSam system protein B [Lentisphaerae bacterium]|nr:AmmeMemoRadiSam system protein B [Lentisphaerota bacterium]
MVKKYLIGILLIVTVSAGCNRTDSSQKAVEIKKSVTVVARPPAVAGSFYDEQTNVLRRRVQLLMDQAVNLKIDAQLIAAIVPHAGYVFSGRCAASAYRLIGQSDYRRVIVLGPSHYVAFSGISLPEPNLTHYRTPLGDVPIDTTTCKELASSKGFSVVEKAGEREHCIEVQLPFLQQTITSFELVPLLCGAIPEDQINYFANAISAHIDNKTLLLVSSDFTHYGTNYRFVPFRENIKDNLYQWLTKATGFLSALDIDGFNEYYSETKDTICGVIPIKIMMVALKSYGNDVFGRTLDCYTSGDVVGDYKNSVSYATVGFFSNKHAKNNGKHENIR